MFNINYKIDAVSMMKPLLPFLIILVLPACGSSSDGSSQVNADAITRVLNDSPVNGVSYTCDGQTGVTNNGGEFICKSAPVIFSIGGLTLGTINSFNNDNQVYPQDFSGVGRDDLSDVKTIKIARLLQSLDDDGNISQSIDIPASIAEKYQNITNIDDLTLEQLAGIAGIDLVTKPYAISHLRRTLSGGEDRSDYIIRVDLIDANSSNALTADVALLIKGAEVLNSEKTAANKITLSGLSKVTTLYLKNIPEADQDIKVIIQADGYIDSGVSITLSEAVKFYNLNLSLVKDDEGVVANGVFASEMVVSNKVDNSGTVTHDIVLENKETLNKPGVKLTIPAGTVLTDKNGTPVIGAKLKVTSFDPYQSDAIAAYPGGLNVMAEASGFNIGGVPQLGETEINFKSAGFAAISIVDDEGNKVKNFSNDIVVAMQFAIGTTDGDGNTVAIGDAVPIWSYDEDTGKWGYEKEGMVQDLDPLDGLYDVVYSLNHLSYWNLDWKYGNKCDFSSKFILKNAAAEPHAAGKFAFRVMMQSSPSIVRWFFSSAKDQDDFVQFNNAPAETPGVFEVWTRDRSTQLASRTFAEACGNADLHLVFEYDDATYEYEAAIAILEALNNVADKSIGVRPILSDIGFVLTVAELLDAQGDSRGNELLLDVANVMLLYSADFIENREYTGVTLDIYGCDSNQQRFIDELTDNFYYQGIYSGPLAGFLGSTVLPYLETASNGFAGHNPTQLAYAPYGLRGFIRCGFSIAEQLSAFGDESGTETVIYEHFEGIVLSNVASMRADIENELANFTIVSFSSGASFIFIIDQAISIAEELAATTGFSSSGLTTLNETRAYYEDLQAAGKIEDLMLTD